MHPDADVFFTAAELIAQHGLAKGDYKTKDGCLCILGALNVALGRNAASSGIGTISAAAHVRRLVRKTQPGYVTAHQWNDMPERTAEEVIDVLIAAAYFTEEELLR